MRYHHWVRDLLLLVKSRLCQHNRRFEPLVGVRVADSGSPVIVFGARILRDGAWDSAGNSAFKSLSADGQEQEEA